MKSSKPAKNPHDRRHHLKMKSRRESYILKKTGGTCELCKEHWASDVLCFHHLDPEDKEFGLSVRKWSSKNLINALKEADKCAILCMNCHALEHKALNRGETLINDPDAYLRYRNHRFTEKQPDLFDRADMDDRNDGPGDEDQEEFPFAFV